MSIKRTEKVKCPYCGKKQKFTVWDSINTAINPEMKDAVRDDSAFTLTCTRCGKESPVDYEFLYHQMEDNLMIYYFHDVETAARVLNSDVLREAGFEKYHYLLRTVTSLEGFQEKLRIFDEGLDDRLIELYKAICACVYIEKNYPNVREVETLFRGTDQDVILLDTKTHMPIASCNFDMSTYKTIQEKYLSKLPDIREDAPIIDENYAMTFFNNLSDDEKVCLQKD